MQNWRIWIKASILHSSYTTDMCMFIDLKVLNKKYVFYMPTKNPVCKLNTSFRTGDWMISLDLQECIPTCTNSPTIEELLVLALLRLQHQLVDLYEYIDDFLSANQDKTLGHQNKIFVIQLISLPGFLVHQTKSTQ